MTGGLQRVSQAVANLPIRQKLMVIILLTTCVALVLAGIGFILADSFLFYRLLKHDLSTFSQIVADNTTAALSFDDPESAQETLAALKARTHLVAACVYKPDGSVFARYIRPGYQESCPPSTIAEQDDIWDRQITMSREILLNNRPIGKLVILYDLNELGDRVLMYGFTVLLVLVLSVLIAFLVSSRLRDLVATPISQLVEVATSISKSKDYTIRARKSSPDELGILVSAFNEMLSGIQERDRELRKALQDVQRSNQSLARSNEDLERFAFIASHDLREPLRMINLYSQLLLRQCPDVGQGPGAESVSNIISSISRMQNLLSDLLAYTEIGARFEQPPDRVDLNTVVAKVLQNLKASIEDCGGKVTSDLLPTVSAYEAHLIPLFQNLIGNAIKYRGEEPPSIQISVEEIEGYFRIAIADNGIGIDPEYHTRIFAAFKRLHGKQIPGTGIGLAICQRVVERYGGRIWVESRAGEGSKFVFTLPKLTMAKRSIA